MISLKKCNEGTTHCTQIYELNRNEKCDETEEERHVRLDIEE